VPNVKVRTEAQHSVYKTHKYTAWQNAGVLNVRACGTYIYRRDLESYLPLSTHVSPRSRSCHVSHTTSLVYFVFLPPFVPHVPSITLSSLFQSAVISFRLSWQGPILAQLMQQWHNPKIAIRS